MRPSRPLALRRAAALGLLAAVGLAVHLALVAPLLAAWSEAGQDIVQARERLDGLAALAGAAERLRSALAEREAAAGKVPPHYRAASDTLVAVQVQDRVKQAVERAGGTLASLRVLPTGEEEPFRRVALRVQVTATLAGLQRCLHDLEATRPYLVLDNLSVTAPVAPAPAPPAAGADPVLTIRFDLQTFARIGKP